MHDLARPKLGSCPRDGRVPAAARARRTSVGPPEAAQPAHAGATHAARAPRSTATDGRGSGSDESSSRREGPGSAGRDGGDSSRADSFHAIAGRFGSHESERCPPSSQSEVARRQGHSRVGIPPWVAGSGKRCPSSGGHRTGASLHSEPQPPRTHPRRGGRRPWNDPAAARDGRTRPSRNTLVDHDREPRRITSAADRGGGRFGPGGPRHGIWTRVRGQVGQSWGKMKRAHLRKD